jgi:hypothetical protein
MKVVYIFVGKEETEVVYIFVGKEETAKGFYRKN